MPGLDPVVFLSPSSIGTAIEVTVASLASPTELNSISASQGDLIIARTVAAGTDDCVIYYADTTSDAQSLPYIVDSLTSGLKWVAVAGKYMNAAPAIAALTASRVVATDASKNLDTPATVTTGQTWAFTSTLTVVDGNLTITGSSDATKALKFEVDAQTANDTLTIDTGAQTDSRTLTVPVLTGNRTLAVIDQAQTFTAAQTMSSTLNVTGTVTGGAFAAGSGATGLNLVPNQGAIITNNVSSYWYISDGNTFSTYGTFLSGAAGHIIMQPRTSAARGMLFLAGTTTPTPRIALFGGAQGVQIMGNGAEPAVAGSAALGAILRVSGGTIATAQPVIDSDITWNAAVTFTAWKLNVTNTNSNTDSLLADLQVGGTSAFRVYRNGSVRLNNAALATTATDGFLYAPTCAGTPTGVPTSLTGGAPIVIDTSANKLWFYSGGAWRDAGP